MKNRRMVARRLEEEVQEEDTQGGLAPQGVQLPQDAQVPPQRQQVPIWGEGNDVPEVPLDMING